VRVRQRKQYRARIEMIPLIDVVFLLLVAFILFTMTMTVRHGIPVDLPASSTAPVARDDCVRITVTAQGALYLDEKEVNAAELPLLLRMLRKNRPDMKVVVSGDRNAPYEAVVTVLDRVRKSGIDGVSLDTKWK